jgi:hypothetical protein
MELALFYDAKLDIVASIPQPLTPNRLASDGPNAKICLSFRATSPLTVASFIREDCMATGSIGLGDLIVTTAQEIRDARDRSAKVGDPVLKFEGCELELKVTISAEAGAGIKVWLVDLSTKGEVERASTITLRFGPAAGQKPEVFLVDRDRVDEKGEKIVPARRAIRGKGSKK